MKIARFVLKIMALALSVAATACCIIAFWDKIADGFTCVREKIADRRTCCHSSEYDDYADWDE